MTEDQWLTCNNPAEMLTFLRTTGKASNRKLRLFAVACCRSVWPMLEDERSRAAVEGSELLADGRITDDERRQLRHAAQVARNVVPRPMRSAARAAYEACHRDSLMASDYAHSYASFVGGQQREAVHLTKFASFLLDIFGNPFRLVIADVATPTVRSLAQAIYDERAFAPMPILADALEEAGCTDANILTHCRGPGPHVLGCWVVDLILGKS